MSLNDVLRFYVAARLGVGVALFAAPRRAGSGWIGGEAFKPGPAVLSRAVGARDLALGLGTVLALRSAPAAARP